MHSRPDYLPEPREEWTVLKGVPFQDRNGPLWHRVVDGQYETCLKLQDFHGNLYGYIHGGMTATFADHALGVAALGAYGGSPAVTVQLDLRYVSGAKVGELLTCRAEVVRKTRSLAFMRGDIMASDRCIAIAAGIWKVIES